MRLWLVAVVVALAPSARADIDGDRFESREWRVRMTAPKNWRLTEQTSYPSILLWMVRTNPSGKMLLSAEKLSSGVTPLEYAMTTSKLLRKMGFRPRAPQVHSSTGAYWVDYDNGIVFLRQAFIVANNIGYSLTLAAPDSRTRGQYLRAFDFALRSIRPIRDKPSASPPTDAKDAGPPPAPDGGP